MSIRTLNDTSSRRRRFAGYSLVEMLIVVALIGVVATMAMPSFVNSSRRARESVLRHDLWILRSVIDQFFTDKGRYPSDIEELVQSGYIRRVPIDPITESPNWEAVWATQLADDEPEGLSGDGGMVDVRSSSTQRSLDGSLYSEW